MLCLVISKTDLTVTMGALVVHDGAFVQTRLGKRCSFDLPRVSLVNPFRVVLGRAYRGLTGGVLLLQNFSVAISVSPHVCLF